MKDIGYVYGTQAEAKPLSIEEKLVYVRTDIEKVTAEESGHPYRVWKYHEYWFTKDEYLKLVSEQSEESSGILAAILGV